jgi:hypothetical protein
MSNWFEDISQNQYTRANQAIAERMNAMDFNPNAEAQVARLDWLRDLLESVPQTNRILKMLLSNEMKQLLHKVEAADDDRIKRAAKAVAECDENLGASWAATTDLMDRASINQSYAGSGGTLGAATTLGLTLGGLPASVAGLIGTGVENYAAGGLSGSIDPNAAQSGTFGIPGQVNEVSQWALQDAYKYEPWEGVGGVPKLDNIGPAAWLQKYLAGSGLRPIGAQENLSGMQMAEMQEAEGWLKSGSPTTSKGYMDVMDMFPGYWQDLVQRSMKVMPQRRTQTTPWYASLQA